MVSSFKYQACMNTAVCGVRINSSVKCGRPQEDQPIDMIRILVVGRSRENVGGEGVPRKERGGIIAVQQYTATNNSVLACSTAAVQQ